ncbi:MAG: glycoside hydrolase family 3 N-terminal domain-containing protein [Solirubrobacterales bacterium]
MSERRVGKEWRGRKFGRLYSTHERKVSRLGGAFIASQQRQGVAATAKHFPGLGAAGAEDTDSGPVTLDLSKRTLRDVDEFPYENAISEGLAGYKELRETFRAAA